MKKNDVNSLNSCLERARSWLVKTNDKHCRRYGLRVDLLVINKIKHHEEMTRWDAICGEIKLGWLIVIRRHPAELGGRLDQVWRLFYDGSLALKEEHPGFTRSRYKPKYHGRFVSADELFGVSNEHIA